MTSFKSQSINFLLRNRHLFRGKKRKEVFDMTTSIGAFREACEKGATRYAKIPAGITIKPLLLEGITCEWAIPAQSPPEKMIFYVHGGGYVAGSCSDHRGFVSKFAQATGIATFIYEYRLAPEHPFPAAVDDSICIYRRILSEGFTPENIVFAGESAGGGLCLALLLAMRENELPMPAAAVAISPWTDLTCSSDSYHTKNKRSLAPLNSWNIFSEHYRGNQPASHPLISPLFGNLKGLPPLLINSGTDDELFEDGEKFVQKARAAGVDATFRAGVGQVHCYPLFAPLFPEATEAMNEIVGFITQHLNM